VKIALDVDDRILTAAGGAVAAAGCFTAALVLLRSTARVQAARSALLGRPTAYRLHLHGTGLEFASWERNFVGECVVRHPPEHGIRMADDVPPRPGQGGGSLFRDTSVIGAPGAGFYADLPDPDVTADAPDEGRAAGALPLPALCDNGHIFADRKYGTIADLASITHRTPVGVKCPECGGHAEIAAGHYFIHCGQVVREDIAEGEA
jgi:hypothetical protein